MNKIPMTFFKFTWFFLKKQKMGFLLLVLASFVTSFSVTIWPYVTAKLIDALDQFQGPLENAFDDLKEPLFMAFSFWLFIELLSRVRGYIASVVMPKFQAGIRIVAFSYVSNHSHNYFVNNYVGGIANRIADLPRGAHLVLDVLITIFFPIMMSLVIACSTFFSVNAILSLILFVWMFIHITVLIFMSKKAAHLSRVQSEARTLIQGKIVDCISNHLNVRLFTSHEHESKQILHYQEDEKKKLQRSMQYVEYIKLILGLIGIVGVSILFVATFDCWQRAEISIGSFVLVINTIVNLIAQMGTASEEITYLLREIGVCQQALRVFQDPISIKDGDEATELVVEEGTIRFENVTFRYRTSENLFYNQSLTIFGGQKIGLVGFSGSGKTTFASLLLRLFDVDSGRITIDHQDIQKVTTKSLRENISFISQEPILFHRSVRENIIYGKRDATGDEIVRAAKLANCHDFILNLEEGYNTQVGERGSKLSGGQRQRIAIARAILKNAPIVIMDEATSALDAISEKLIRDSINYLIRGKTTIIIAHKFSTLMDMDRILVFHNGEIIEDGTHEELIKQKAHYEKMWHMQTGDLLPGENKPSNDKKAA